MTICHWLTKDELLSIVDIGFSIEGLVNLLSQQHQFTLQLIS
ncbi:hypothetical protein [Photorhabdus hainanensis]|nr:hypothetical protein [Photorhabdus hainanensis]